MMIVKDEVGFNENFFNVTKLGFCLCKYMQNVFENMQWRLFC